MESSAPDASGPSGRATIGSYFIPRSLIFFWGAAVLITSLHYATPHSMHWFHDILRRLYYLPLVYYGFVHGKLGALIGAIFVTILYFPHAFMAGIPRDPAQSIEKILEICTYFGAAGVAGVLGDRERVHVRALEANLRLLRALQDELVRKGRLEALGNMVSGLSHELKNPLHVLRGTAEVIADLVPKEGKEARLWANHVSEIERMERITGKYLSFAKDIGKPAQTLEVTPTLEKVTDLLRLRAEKAGIVIETSLPAEPLRVHATDDELVQVLINIAFNACDHLSPGGRIRVSAASRLEHGRPMAVIIVANDGPKIPPSDVEKIFDPFYSTRESGSGLGLFISQNIIQNLDGFIRLHQDDEVAFEIHLPVA
ncbi:hypothetical protein KKD52_04170 [Myxococcota bacterium]|nr:hypothetical protein [Myxococcota bacterium]MBU1410193.1 hypothetical protein [Myxococcota bacterium]MBU1509538.1 hypothetical protein [Myxococcota bacterium]